MSSANKKCRHENGNREMITHLEYYRLLWGGARGGNDAGARGGGGQRLQRGFGVACEEGNRSRRSGRGTAAARGGDGSHAMWRWSGRTEEDRVRRSSAARGRGAAGSRRNPDRRGAAAMGRRRKRAKAARSSMVRFFLLKDFFLFLRGRFPHNFFRGRLTVGPWEPHFGFFLHSHCIIISEWANLLQKRTTG